MKNDKHYYCYYFADYGGLWNKIVRTYSFKIEGMHCGNCANAVTRAINDIDGAAARVSLNKKTAKVICDRVIDAIVIEEIIRKLGYEAVLINDVS